MIPFKFGNIHITLFYPYTSVFFKVIMEKASYEIIRDLFPAIIERSVQLFQIKQYQENVLE